ncbi:hypothetical protein [Streptomyces misionensis]
MYKLRYTEAVEAVWDSLPDGAREEFEHAIAAACEDPWAKTQPRDEDDPQDVRRLLILRHTATALLIIEGPPIRWVYARHIDYLG